MTRRKMTITVIEEMMVNSNLGFEKLQAKVQMLQKRFPQSD